MWLQIDCLSTASLLGTPVLSAQGTDALCSTPVNLNVNVCFCAGRSCTELMLLCWSDTSHQSIHFPSCPSSYSISCINTKSFVWWTLTVSTFYRCQIVAAGSPWVRKQDKQQGQGLHTPPRWRSSLAWDCSSHHLSRSSKLLSLPVLHFLLRSTVLPGSVSSCRCRWLNEAVWAAGSPASLSLLSLPINTEPFVSGLIVPLPSQSPFCALLPAQSLCSGVFSSAALCLWVFIVPASECVCWERGGGAPVCVGFINLVQS